MILPFRKIRSASLHKFGPSGFTAEARKNMPVDSREGNYTSVGIGIFNKCLTSGQACQLPISCRQSILKSWLESTIKSAHEILKIWI